MNYEFSALCYIRFLSGLFALILIAVLLKRRHSQGAVFLMLFEVAAAIWAISDGFEAAATTVNQKLLWAQIAYTGITTSAVMFLMFALSYTNHNRLTNRKVFLLLMVVPIITMFMALTNPIHKLLWSDISIIAGTNLSIYNYGPWFWIFLIYEYSVLSTGIIILLKGAFKGYSQHKVQVWMLITGSLLPYCASILYVFKLLPFQGLDPTPISFIISGLIVAFGIFWLDMFNIMTIARKQAIDNLRDGMFIVDGGNRVVDANPAFLRALNLSKKQIIGNFSDIAFARLNINIDQFSPENDYTIETQIKTESDLLDFEVKNHLLKDKNGKIVGKIFIISDITTKKMILDTFAESNYRRKNEIIEKEKLIRDLNAYARSVAHDLKNPIGSVISLSELIKESLSANDKDEAIEMIDLVHDQSRKMLRIIDDLLILSTIRKEEVSIVPINIKRSLAEALSRLSEESKKLKAEIDVPDHWPLVLGHEQWIEEVWVNLLSNALKYGGDPPHIKVGFRSETSSTIRFFVQDNGKGLPAESLLKLFNDFERLGRKDIEGHGLGLPIVKRIIEKLGGTVKVESTFKEGEGCIFSFTLKEDRKIQL